MNTKKLHFIYVAIIAVLIMAVVWVSVALGSRLYKQKNISYYDQKVAVYELENENFAKGQIVFIGDSLIDYFPLDAYFSDLDLATYNRGISGDTTQGLLDRLDVSLYQLKPTKAVILIGSNDVDPGVENEIILNTYEQILFGIKQNLPTCEVYVISLTSENLMWEGLQKEELDRRVNQINELNPLLENLAGKYGYEYLDLFSLTVDDSDYLKEEYTVDGVHFNNNGFIVWSNLLKPYLQ